MKNMESSRFRMRKAPLPAKKIPFHRGKNTSEAIDATAMTAITIHITVSIVFFFAIIKGFILQI